ncbi:MAG: S8/S53 family peptidase [Gaiellales bacterium]
MKLVATHGLALALALSLFAVSAADATTPLSPGDDVVVIAVVDDGLWPYYWDFSAAKMPQATDADSTNDLPLRTPPDQWLRGFPATETFQSFDSFDISLDDKNLRHREVLRTMDEAEWENIKHSHPGQTNYYWIPGTKIIGFLEFGETPAPCQAAERRCTGPDDPGVEEIGSSPAEHGTRVASVAAGNFHGSCADCLLVFVSAGFDLSGAEAALEWATSQPWIDAVTNSYGSSSTPLREGVDDGSDTEAQRQASERGQTIFFSAGNGLRDLFGTVCVNVVTPPRCAGGTMLIPNPTYLSSQRGPDWIVTVGAVSPGGGTYTGAGKPVDIAAPGRDYPSAGGDGNSDSSTFGGTSNAAPVVAGLYAEALYWARKRLDGPSRIQADGVIAMGAPVACGSSNPTCELADGVLDAQELRTRLFDGASRAPRGMTPGYYSDDTDITTDEYRFMAEGHGVYTARLGGTTELMKEIDAITLPMDGSAAALPPGPGETEWFRVDSFCRQQIWGSWSAGYYRVGSPLPDPSPLWPLRTTLAAGCAAL